MFWHSLLKYKGQTFESFYQNVLVSSWHSVPFAQDRVGLQEISVLKVIQISFGLASACSTFIVVA
jgi:hypothetical protein